MTPMIWVSFHFLPIGARLSADLPTETHGGRFGERSKTGDFTWLFPPELRGIVLFFHVEAGFQDLSSSVDALLGIRQAAALCQRGHPPSGEVGVLPRLRFAFKERFWITGNSLTIAYAPAPLGAVLA
jgi:hypothetical protein